MTGFDPSRTALQARAAHRLQMAGVSFHPPITAPSIVRNHIDGPYLHRLDGTLRWLSFADRVRLWLGRVDAWDLERKYQRQEWRANKPSLSKDSPND